MKKHYATYELSKLAKDAGFDEECEKFYYNEIFKTYYPPHNNSFCIEFGLINAITAPELTVLQQWVWETFNVWIFANQEPQSKKNHLRNQVYFNYSIKKLGADISLDTTSFDCPYEALEKGLIEFLTKKQNEK